jgi:hypothetical protein
MVDLERKLMPHIWDDNKVVANIGVLGKLFDSKVAGKKLDINSNGTLSIYIPSTFGIQGLRRFSQPSITSEDNFAAPIVKLFKKAKKEGVANEVIEKAINGINSLKDTYKDNPTKKDAVNNLVLKIKGSLIPGGLLDFIRDYKAFMAPYSFAQMQFLESTSNGACMAFTYFWIINKYNDKEWYYTVDYIIKNLDIIKNFQIKYEKFPQLRVGGRIDYAAEELNLEEHQFEEVKIDGGFKIIENYSGSQIFKNVLKAARQSDDPKLFIFTFEGAKPHAMGLDFRDERIDFFDPNFGEIRFNTSQGKAFYNFCDHMWAHLYGDVQNGLIYWDLYQFCY